MHIANDRRIMSFFNCFFLLKKFQAFKKHKFDSYIFYEESCFKLGAYMFFEEMFEYLRSSVKIEQWIIETFRFFP